VKHNTVLIKAVIEGLILR